MLQNEVTAVSHLIRSRVKFLVLPRDRRRTNHFSLKQTAAQSTRDIIGMKKRNEPDASTPLPKPKRQHVHPESPTSYVTGFLNAIENLTVSDVRKLLQQQTTKACAALQTCTAHIASHITAHDCSACIDRVFQVWLIIDGSENQRTWRNLCPLLDLRRKKSSWTTNLVVRPCRILLRCCFPRTSAYCISDKFYSTSRGGLCFLQVRASTALSDCPAGRTPVA